MPTTPTNNPITSESPRDLSFNAGKVDEFVNSPEEAFSDRFGLARLTLAGIQAEADNVIGALGFVPVDSFEAGATISSRNQALHYLADNNYYRWDGSLTSPKVVAAGSTPTSSGGVAAGAWVNVTDNTLRSQLAAANGVDLVNGAAKQSDLDLKTNAYVTPEQYSSLVVGSDWTAALNAALATGKPVLTSNVTYSTSGQINSMGNRFFGGGKIQCTQYPLLPVADMQVSESDDASIRMMYLAESTNLAEYLVIKKMGFNQIDWHPHTNTDAIQCLDNALTAGLKVRLTTSDITNANISAFVAAVDYHPALIGYSVIDEPATRGFSVADQDTRINLFRAVTSKELSMVDLAGSLGNSAAFNQLWSTNYDLVFVDAYSLYYPSGTYAQWLKDDLNKFRFDYGAIMAQTGCNRVIPMVSAYAESAGQPAPYYSQDVDQVVAASSIFGKVNAGNFAAFVWDYPFDTTFSVVRNNAKLIKLCTDLASQKVRKAVNFEAYIFGGSGTKFWDLQGLIKSIPVADKASTDPYAQQLSYPVRVKSGVSNTDRITTTSGVDYSGIGYKGSVGTLVTTIKSRNHICLKLEYFTIDNALTSSFDVITTEDGGYTISAPIYSAGITPGSIINADVNPAAYGSEFPDRSIGLRITTTGDSGVIYRKFLRGMIITSDW